MRVMYKLADGQESIRHEVDVVPRIGETVDLGPHVFGQRVSGEVADVRHFPHGFRNDTDPFVIIELHATMPSA